jgi:branched-chain amino acid transport system substrate-binding protein
LLKREEDFVMKPKNLLILLVNICLIVVLATPVFSQAKGKPVKIGFLYELTGIFSTMGADAQRTVEVWVELINKAGGIKGHPIEYVTADSQSNATQATLAAKKLVDTEKIHVLLGSNTYGCALAVAPICETNEVPFITATVADLVRKKIHPYWTFTATYYGWEQVDMSLSLVKDLNPNSKKISVLYMGAPFGKDLYNYVKYFAPKRNLQILAAEEYDTSKTDFGPQIIKLMAGNPDAVVVYCSDMAGPLAMKQMREMGLNKPIIANGTLNVKAIREAFKDVFSIPPYVYMTGTHGDIWWQLPKDSQEYKVISPVASEYERKFGEKYGGIHQVACNGINILGDSLERAFSADPDLLSRDLKTIRTKIRQKIEETKDFNAGSGIFNMAPNDHCGIVLGSNLCPVSWKNGEIVYLPELLKDYKVLPAPPADL